MKRFLIVVIAIFFIQPLSHRTYASVDSLIRVITDRSIPFQERYTTMSNYFDYFPEEQRNVLLKQLAFDSKKSDNKNQTISLYSNVAFSLALLEPTTAKLYLDTALMYENDVDDISRAKLYYTAGEYHRFLWQIEQAHEYYYKSLPIFEKAGIFYDFQLQMTNSIAQLYIEEKDTASLKTIIDKMRPLTEKDTSVLASTLLNFNIAHYYSILHDFDKGKSDYVDSSMLYYSKIIQKYESIPHPPPIYDSQIAHSYMKLALFNKDLPKPDWNIITKYAHKAIELDHENPYTQVSYHLVKSAQYAKLHQLDASLQEAQESLRLFYSIDNESYKSVNYAVYEQLSEIHELRKEYEQALKYERLSSEAKTKLYNEERHRIAKNLQTKYEVAKKDENIRQLSEQNRYRQNINRLYLGMLILIALVGLFVILWFRGKRKADANQLKIMKLQSYLEGLESERSRLAREMHDHVSNGLLALEIKMQSSGVPDELTTMANNLHQQVREISYALIPPVFQYASLPEIIDEYVREQNRLKGPCFQFYLSPEDGWENLSYQTALDLYRIVQEACSNAIKHAGAKNVVISLARLTGRNDGGLTLSITDDGCGFQPADATKGIGLQTINERAANQNGVVTVDSSSGNGTTVKLRIENYELRIEGSSFNINH